MTFPQHIFQLCRFLSEIPQITQNNLNNIVRYAQKFLEGLHVKTDIRTQFTKNVIRTCFFELLKEMPINKITVKAICEKANINRTTFYRYYRDPFDLIEQIENELLEAFLSHVKGMKKIDMETALKAMFSAILHNQETYLILISENADRFYIRKMITETYKFFKDGMEKRYPELSENQRRWLYYYVAQGSIGITIDWLERGMKESPDEMAQFTAGMNRAVLTPKNALL